MLWNESTIIENYLEFGFVGIDIIDLFDGGYNKHYNFDNFWFTDEMFRINMKRYGDCLLRIGLDIIVVYYIKTEEEIKEELRKLQEAKRKEQEEIEKKAEEYRKKYGEIKLKKNDEQLNVYDIFDLFE